MNTAITEDALRILEQLEYLCEELLPLMEAGDSAKAQIGTGLLLEKINQLKELLTAFINENA